MQTSHQAYMLLRVSNAAYMTAAVRVTAVLRALTACQLVHCTSALQHRDYWARFERFVKTLAWSSDDVYIVTGPLYVPQRTPQGYVMHHPMIGLSHSHIHVCSSQLHASGVCGDFFIERQHHRNCHCF